jgi:ABC-type molybdate transport system permease subunit
MKSLVVLPLAVRPYVLATSRHIILTSDGPLGRFLLARLGVKVPYHALLRQVTKIRLLDER